MRRQDLFVGMLGRLPHEVIPKINAGRPRGGVPMQFHCDLSALAPTARFSFDADQQVFFADFSGCVIRHLPDVERIRVSLLTHLEALGRKVPAIVNYEGFTLLPGGWDAYVDMARQVAQTHYNSVSRHTKHAFLRAKLGKAFHQRGIAPHIVRQRARCAKVLVLLAPWSWRLIVLEGPWNQRHHGQ
jgi:propionate CoA-transferase